MSNQEAAAAQVAEKKKPLTRDQIRGQVLGTKAQALVEELVLFGTTIELRQPAFGDMLDARDIVDTKTRTIELIIQYAFVPGTDEPVFEIADRDVMLKWPFGEDIVRLQSAIARLTGIDIDSLEEKLLGNPLDES